MQLRDVHRQVLLTLAEVKALEQQEGTSMIIKAVERAFALLSVLREESDERHPMTLAQIESVLESVGHVQARQSVVASLETLRACGYDIQKVAGSSPAAFYLGDRELSREGVEAIALGLASSRYVSDEQTRSITRNCFDLLSRHQRDDADFAAQVIGRHTADSVDWSRNVRKVSRAIACQSDLSFVAVAYDSHGVSVPLNDGNRYRVCPLALAYVEEVYYMLATSDGVSCETYRVDHMRSIQAEDASVEPGKARTELDVTRYTERSFSMQRADDGCDRRVELLVAPDCTDSVIDYFGRRRTCKMVCAGLDGTYISVSVSVQPSRAFYGWLAGFLGGVRIIAPDDLRREFVTACATLAERASS